MPKFIELTTCRGSSVYFNIYDIRAIHGITAQGKSRVVFSDDDYWDVKEGVEDILMTIVKAQGAVLKVLPVQKSS